MRLTLRTLLAWLDDTLPPKDVARIGRQLQKSKFAQDLGQRIQRVIRQRRLTVPGMGANTPIDANVISAYLDNNLPPEQIAAVESLCINSDVHLAEVAACHQILVLLEQPVEISPQQYSAMYRLVKGNESRIPSDHQIHELFANQSRQGRIETGSRLPTGKKHADTASILNELKSNRSGGRLLILTNCMLIMSLAAFAYWLNSMAGTQQTLITKAPASISEPTGANEKSQPEMKSAIAEINPNAADIKPEVEITRPAEPEPAKVVVETNPVAEKPARKPVANNQPMATESLPISEVLSRSKNAILLYSESGPGVAANENGWKLIPADFKAESGRIRFADPEPVSIALSEGELGILSGTELEWNSKSADQNTTALIHSGTIRLVSSGPIAFLLKISPEKELHFKLSANSACIVKTMPFADFSMTNSLKNRPIQLICEKGSCVIESGPVAMPIKSELASGQAVLLQSGKENGWQFSQVMEVNKSGWPTEVTSLQLTSQQIARYLKRERPLASKLMEATADMQKPVRDQAVKIAMWAGRDDLLLQSSNEAGSGDLRRSVITALRDGLEMGDASSVTFLTDLVKTMQNPEISGIRLRQFITRPGEALSELSPKDLVESLQDMNVLVRELALDHLKSISGRDSLEYNPDMPEMSAINAWARWLEAQSPEK